MKLPKALRVAIVLGGLALVGLAALLVLRTRHAGALIPAAPSTAPDEAEAPMPASLLAVPVTVSLAPFEAELEQAVPRRYGNLEDRFPVKGTPGLSLALVLRREPFRVSFVGQEAVVHGRVSYALKAWYTSPFLPGMVASCGNGGADDPRLSLTVRGPISLEPDWRLSTRAGLADLRPASSSPRDRCRVTSLGLDVTDEVVAQARTFLERQAGALDTAVARFDVRGPAERAWRELEQPVPLGDSLWLLVHPESIRRGPLCGLGDSVEVTLALSARPTVVVGAEPEASEGPLPPLDTGAVSPGLDVRVEGQASYPQISRVLQREMGGTRVKEMGRTVVLDSLRVYGIGGGKVAVEVQVGGDASGLLYLTGTPVLDTAHDEVAVPDLDFDVHTRDLVLAAESWLASGRLRQVLRDQARWPAAPALDWLRGRLRSGLNRRLSEGLRVEGAVDSARLDGIRATKEGILVRASATGSASLHVRAR